MASSLDPAITVLMPVYNAEAFVGQAIESILRQTFADFELLIINDGSTDGSKKIIESFKDQRIRFVDNEKNIKLIATLNKGIDLAKGKYIARMDADDISSPNRLEKQYRLMESHPEIGICGSCFESFGKVEKEVRYPEKDEDIRIMMLYQTPFCHPTVMLRKDVLVRNQIYFNPEYLHAEDYELWVRAADFTRYANLQEVLLKYRVHEENISVQHQDLQIKNTIRIIKEYLQKAGAVLNDYEVKTLRSIAYSMFTTKKEEIIQFEQILLKIINANCQSNYLPEKQLEEFVSGKWENICFNATTLGWWIYKKGSTSQLSGLPQGIQLYKLKLFLKAVLRLQ